MVIDGTGVTVNASGNGTDGVFEDDTAATSVQITGLTIENGTHTTGDSFGGGFELQAGATLTLDSVTFSGNTASAGGGAIYDNGTLTVDDSTFNSNSVHWNHLPHGRRSDPHAQPGRDGQHLGEHLHRERGGVRRRHRQPLHRHAEHEQFTDQRQHLHRS